MKKQSVNTSSKDSQQTRRDFVKNTTAAGAGLFIVPSKNGGKWHAMEHIPPIYIGGGSLNIEVMHTLSPRVEQSGPPNRPMRLFADNTLASEQYGEIASVQVISERRLSMDTTTYTIPTNSNARLLIWLQEVKEGSTSEEEFDPKRPDAHILIQGNIGDSPSKTVLIESYRQLGPRQRTYKSYRKNRYSHPKLTVKDFRIGKWQIVDARGKVLHEDDAEVSGVNGYQFLVFFAHVAH
jgi:hypothetical protein